MASAAGRGASSEALAYWGVRNRAGVHRRYRTNAFYPASTDFDLAEYMYLVKTQTRKPLGLVTPGAPARKTSKELSEHADFAKPIRRWMFDQSLFPSPISGTTIRKPLNW